MDFRKGIITLNLEENRVNLKKGYFGYRIVHPIKNEDGSWNYKNLIYGGIPNLIFLVLCLLLLSFLMYSYLSDIETYKETIKEYEKNPLCSGKTVNFNNSYEKVIEFGNIKISEEK